MRSWILALLLAFAASGAWAEEAPTISAPDVVPPIPSPLDAATRAVVPTDGPWPAAPADGVAVVDDSGAPVALPSIPAPPLSNLATPEGQAVPAKAAAPEGDGAAAATPKPAKMRPAFDPAGTIHVVVKGDTLWDISDAYLGTPWIWPSVWRDNADIENPHLILPGDKIWVSATEMRKVTDAEAAALLAAREAGGDDSPMPAAMAEDAPPVPMPEAPKQHFYYPELPSVGIVSKKELVGLGQVVGTTEEQVMLTQGDVVFIDLGDQDTQVGDEFVIFETGEKVYNPANNRVLGRYTETIGWLEVTDVYAESSKARVRMAYDFFVPGAYLKPRDEPSNEIEIQASPEGVEGQLADLMIKPKYLAGGDIVVLNRGSEDGLQEGSPLEIYRPVSDSWKSHWYGRRPDVEIPHEVIAQMIVLKTQERSAMAYVRTSKMELQYGDRFRTVNGPSVEWPEGGLFILPRLKGLAARIPQPKIGMPDVDIPGIDTTDWSVPRLALPGLGGYDPR